MYWMFDKNINTLTADMIIQAQNVFSQWKQMENNWYDDLKNVIESTEKVKTIRKYLKN